jgi:mono/diheme cytochrome c family protein
MRIVAATIAAVLALILVGAALIYSDSDYPGADKPHWPMMAWLLNEARYRSIRAHAAGITEPAGLDDPARIVAGVAHYSAHCAVCHGGPGVERGDLAEGLYPRPPNLTNSVKLYTPAELFWIVKHGIRMTGMPSWGDHSDDELWATVAFIEKLPGMTDEDYAKLVAASREQVGDHIDQQEPQPVPVPQPTEKYHDRPAAREPVPQTGAASRDQTFRKQHDHLPGHRH